MAQDIMAITVIIMVLVIMLNMEQIMELTMLLIPRQLHNIMQFISQPNLMHQHNTMHLLSTMLPTHNNIILDNSLNVLSDLRHQELSVDQFSL